MKLSHLINAITPDGLAVLGGQDPEVASIHYRSQDVKPGGVFVAVRGLATDGHRYIDDAVKRGAVAVVVQQPVRAKTLVIPVPDTRRALAELAAAFYGDPSAALTVVAVTGTNGKTTTTYLIESILAQAGLSAGVIGTIETRYAGVCVANPVTTPESLDLQRTLADMRAAGVSHAVMEASSHAMAQQRIRNCWMDAAVFTNLTQDHLDFHGDMARYGEAKRQLFTDYLAAGPKAARAVAVINTDSEHGAELAAALRCAVIRVGSTPDCGVRGEGLSSTLRGIRGTLVLPAGRFEFASPLVGRHNIENILCAAGAAAALGIAPQAVRAGIDSLEEVPGRLERVAHPGGPFVLVDYAHTPHALENALAAVRSLSPERVICVFGCGGDRDRTKRPLMGEIAARLSDLAIVTSDNPRSEAPQAIIDEILPGLRAGGAAALEAAEAAANHGARGYVVEPDRRRAIELAVRAAGPRDTVLIAGKGHETYQITGTSVIAFDDREEARRAMAAMGAAEEDHVLDG